MYKVFWDNEHEKTIENPHRRTTCLSARIILYSFLWSGKPAPAEEHLKLSKSVNICYVNERKMSLTCLLRLRKKSVHESDINISHRHETFERKNRRIKTENKRIINL